MRIQLITPQSTNTNIGNHISALRIRRVLRRLGHKITINQHYDQQPCDLLIALHALRSARSIESFHAQYPENPIIVILTGTDLYRDIKTNPLAQQSLEIAACIVVLQRQGIEELPAHLQAKTRVIYQSARMLKRHRSSRSEDFNICVIANLRAVKDPFCTAKAVKLLPASSRIKVNHVGGVLDQEMEREILQEVATNPRYQWLGALSYHQTRRILTNSKLLSITSIMEGASNVLSEAIASDVPVICSKIPGLIGTLGENYPGYFPVGDREMLAKLLFRAESDASFYLELKHHCQLLKFLVDPVQEQQSWQQLLAELFQDD